jgi:sugar diacid utilization regulator
VVDLATSVAELLGGGLAVFDEDGRCLASVDIADPDAAEEVSAIARGQGRTVHKGELWATAVGQCSVVFAPSGAPGGADLRIVERAAMVTALLLLSRRSAAQAESRVRGELLDDLVSRPVEDADLLHERARRLGVALNQANTVLVLQAPNGARHRVANWASSQASEHGGLAADRNGVSVLMLPGDDPSAIARRIGKDLRANLGAAATVGSGGPAYGPAEIADAYRTAQRCADALVALGLTGTSAGPADLGFVGLLMGGGEDSIDGFVTTAIGAVAEYDRRRGTALVQTLESYFAAGGSPARAAELLHVHVNTVTQRLERLSTLLGEEWQRPDRALEIQLALRLHRLRPTTT